MIFFSRATSPPAGRSFSMTGGVLNNAAALAINASCDLAIQARPATRLSAANASKTPKLRAELQCKPSGRARLGVGERQRAGQKVGNGGLPGLVWLRDGRIGRIWSWRGPLVVGVNALGRRQSRSCWRYVRVAKTSILNLFSPFNFAFLSLMACRSSNVFGPDRKHRFPAQHSVAQVCPPPRISETSTAQDPAGTTPATPALAGCLSANRPRHPAPPARRAGVHPVPGTTPLGPGMPFVIGTRARSTSAATSRLPRQAGNSAPSYHASPAGAMEGVHSASGGVTPGRLR